MCLLKVVEDILDRVDQGHELDCDLRSGAEIWVGYALDILDRIGNSRSCLFIALDDARVERRPERQETAGVDTLPPTR
jgi:hypothetical protein